RQNLQGARAEILVSTVQSLLLPWHKEVNQVQAAVRVLGHVDRGLLHGCGRVVTLDGDIGQLRGVTVAGGGPDGASVVGSQTTARHPDATTLDGVGHTLALGSPLFDNLALLIPANDPASEVVL